MSKMVVFCGVLLAMILVPLTGWGDGIPLIKDYFAKDPNTLDYERKDCLRGMIKSQVEKWIILYKLALIYEALAKVDKNIPKVWYLQLALIKYAQIADLATNENEDLSFHACRRIYRILEKYDRDIGEFHKKRELNEFYTWKWIDSAIYAGCEPTGNLECVPILTAEEYMSLPTKGTSLNPENTKKTVMASEPGYQTSGNPVLDAIGLLGKLEGKDLSGAIPNQKTKRVSNNSDLKEKAYELEENIKNFPDKKIYIRDLCGVYKNLKWYALAWEQKEIYKVLIENEKK